MKNFGKLLAIPMVVLTLFTSCEQERAPLALMPHSPEQTELDAERERLNRLQMITVTNATNPDAPKKEKWSSADLAQAVAVGPCGSVGEGESCELSCGACSVMNTLCQANILLELARTRAVPVELSGQGFDRLTGTPNARYLIPPQPTPVNAAMARKAFEKSADALSLAIDAARTAVGLPGHLRNVPCLPSDLDDHIVGQFVVGSPPGEESPYPTMASLLGNWVGEAQGLAREAALRVAELETSFADEQRGNPSLRDAVSRGIAGEQLSRVSAAHILVGGEPGLLGDRGDTSRAGLCSVPNLSAQAQRALAVLRDAGVSPLDVKSTVLTTEQLLNDRASVVSGGSVKQRFWERWGYDDNDPPPGFDANEKVEEYFDLAEADFEEARRYLAQEVTAFSRSYTAKLDPPPVANGYKRFAATAQEPQPLPAAYYSALTTYGSLHKHYAQGIQPSVAVPGEYPNLARVTEAAYANAALIAQAAAGLPSDVQHDLRSALGPVIAGTNSLGRVSLCRPNDGETAISITVGGFNKDSGLILVRGEDGLRCASTGTIEGAPCKLEGSSPADRLKLVSLDEVGSPMPGYDTSVQGELPFQVEAEGQPAAEMDLQGERVYLMRPKRFDDVDDPANGGESRSPGGYEVLLGVHLGGGNNQACIQVPIVPELADRVREIMAPSPKWCTASQVSCAGTAFDERLPLEDELTEDNDGVESSWKHYLSLAKQAASHSDQLGQEYLENGIQYESRLENNENREEQKRELAEQRSLDAIEDLQQICGTAIDPLVLLSLLSTGEEAGLGEKGYDLDKIVEKNTTPPCSAGYKNVLGVCVFDIGQVKSQFKGRADIYSDLVQLDKCLSDDQVIDYVHLGSDDRPLCMWRSPNDKNRLCPGRNEEFPCPVPAPVNHQKGEACETLLKPNDTYKTETVEQGLEVFNSKANASTTATKDVRLCDKVRALRTAVNEDYRDDVVSSGKFTLLQVQELAKKITFRARYGTHASVSSDRVEYSTGNAWSKPPTDVWPCGPKHTAECNGGTGLFCEYYDCSNEHERGKVIDRLARAAVAIESTLGIPQAPPQFVEFAWPIAVEDNVEIAGPQFSMSDPVERLFYGGGGLPVQEFKAGFSSGSLSQDSLFFKVTGRIYEAPAGGKSDLAFILSPQPGFPQEIHTSDWTSGDNFSSPSYRRLMFGNVSPAYKARGRLKPRMGGENYFWDGLSHDGNELTPGYYVQRLNGMLTLGPSGPLPDDTLPERRPFELEFNYEEQAMLDGLELLCELRAPPRPRGSCESKVSRVTSLADLPDVAAVLECRADEIQKFGASTILTSFPRAGLDYLRKNTVGSSGSGALGADVAVLRAALSDLKEVPELIGDQMRRMSYQMENLYFSVENSLIDKRMSRVRLLSDIANQVTACVASTSPQVSGGTDTSFKVSTAAIATCANSIAQISFASEIAQLNEQKLEVQEKINFNEFSENFSTVTEALSLLSLRMTSALNTIEGELAKIQMSRDKAKMALFRALHVNNFTSKHQARLDNVQNARFQTSWIRYRRAQQAAKKLAFLAKRAVEMRLGIRLSQMTADMPLVDAPSKWENSVCTSSGIDYISLATKQKPDYAGAFVGDYLAKLESVVESYRLVNNFHEGTDVAVVSLRDDVAMSRASCEVPVVNALYNAAQLDVSSTEETPGWDRVGCATEVDEDGTLVPVVNCIGTLGYERPEVSMQDPNPCGTAVADGEVVESCMSSPLLNLGPGRSPPAFTLQFGNGGTCDAPSCTDGVENQGETGADCGGPCPACPPPGSSSLPLSASFGSGADGFTYADDTFRGTNNAAFADGILNAGKLEVTVGGIMSSATSGGWSRSFTTTRPGTVDVSFKYGMTVSLSIEPEEWVETLVSIDNVLYGVSPNDYVQRIADGGDQVEVTRTFTSAPLPAGTHTIRLGAHMNAATSITEIGKVTIDDVLVSASVPTCSDRVQNQGETGVDCGGTCSPCPSGKCGYRPGAVLAQKVQVSPGTYRASVYVRDPNLFLNIGLQFKLNDSPITGFEWETEEATLTAWTRKYTTFDVTDFGTLSFEFARPTLQAGGEADEIVLGAPMLERVAPASTMDPPATFANTSETLTQVLPVCEDTTGEVFRATKWRRGSAALCQTGYSGECPGSDAKVNGYWETTFNINQRDIESGHIFGNSGFAKGNFNYRIESIGVNFVGTEIKNCSESDAPSTCYSAGFVPFSLIHGGPYTFRDFEGKDFEAHLFTGRIENARGLASERYFSSPLSSTDRDLMVDFMRSEFQGRPLDGNFILRVWDAPGLDFQSIEDVQVLLKYRYWTRFN